MQRGKMCVGLLVATSALFSTIGWTDETTSAERAITSLAPPAQVSPLGLEVRDERGIDWVALPVPVLNPTIGTGLGATVMGLYRIGEASEPSITALAAFGTDNGSRGAGLFQQSFLGSSQWEVSAALASAKLNLDFYGVGAQAGQGIAIEQRMYGGAVWALTDVAPNAAVGLRYRWDQIRVEPRGAEGALPFSGADLTLDLTESTIEVLVEYDSRDWRFWPTRGWYIDASAAFTDEAIGSDITYQRRTASANWYRSLQPHLVLAVRASACSASERAPFFATCLFGQSNDLRGYVVGRYRGEAMAAAQAELRWRAWKRFGGVVFAGMGDVARRFSEIEMGNRWSGGVGLRFLASPENSLNVGVDVAYAEDDASIYFRIGEAF